MGPAPRVGWAFFPLDEELELGSGGLTPRGEETLVRLATWMPFEQAREMLQELVGVEVSKATVRRATLAAGTAGLEVCEVEAERLKRELPEAPPGADKQAMSADGAFVPLVGGEWGEVKTLVLGQVSRNKREEVCTQQISCFSRLADAESFEQGCLLETHRQGLERATQVCAVQDGAEWLQGLVDHHRPDAVRILDFAHAASAIRDIGEAVRAAGGRPPASWLTGLLHRLKHQGPARVLKHLAWLTARYPSPAAREKLTYLHKRQAQMQYAAFQAAGWPIGSGSVESANKVVVEARLKGAGMHWQRHNVNPMLVLRNAVGNGRWQETWTASRTQRRAFRARQRHERSQQWLTRACWRLAALTVRLHRMACPPAPARTPATASAPSEKPTSRLGSSYSWRRPFLRRPPSSSAVPGGICAKK
jgi:hypothetical protein